MFEVSSYLMFVKGGTCMCFVVASVSFRGGHLEMASLQCITIIALKILYSAQSP